MPTPYNAPHAAPAPHAAHVKVHVSSSHVAHASSCLALMSGAKIRGCSCQSSCFLLSCQLMRFVMPAHVMSLMPAPVTHVEQARATHATSFAQASSCHATLMPIFCFPDASHTANRSANVRVMLSPLSSFQLVPSSCNASWKLMSPMPFRIDRIW